MSGSPVDLGRAGDARIYTRGDESIGVRNFRQQQDTTMARKQPLVLKVSPDIKKDPQVKLSNRAPPAGGRVKIEWRKRKNAAAFDFIGFTPATALQEDG